MRIVAKSENCAGGDCPTVWQDENGAIYVQGYTVDLLETELSPLPIGETLVRIDASLLKALRQV